MIPLYIPGRLMAPLLTLVLCVCAVSGSHAATVTEKVSFNFNESDYDMAYDTHGQLLITSVESVWADPSDPCLPIEARDVRLRDGLSYTGYSFSFTRRLVKSNVVMAPAPEPVPTDMLKIVSDEDPVANYAPGIYPATNCQYALTSTWPQGKVVHFQICPYVYDTRQKSLYFIDTVNVTLTLDDTASSSDPTVPNCVAGNDGAVELMLAGRPALYPPENRVDYLIVTSQNLKDAFEPLLNWKKAKGLYTRLITMEEVLSSYPGATSQLKLKRCLQSLYENNGLKYVLLGGDETVVPVQMCYSKITIGKNEDIRNETITPADLFYACYGGTFDWDGNGNGIYGEVEDDIDFTPYIFITRLLVSSSQHVSDVTSKILDYEKNGTYGNRMLCGGCVISSYDSVLGNSDVEIQGNLMYNKDIKPYWTGEHRQLYDTYADVDCIGQDNFTVDNISSQIICGYDFINIDTHGSVIDWSTQSGSNYRINEADKQVNQSYSIITTSACLTNYFDSSQKCLSESFIQNPKSGIIGYFGSSREGWGYKFLNNYTGSLAYSGKFYKGLFSNVASTNSFGEVAALAKVEFIGRTQRNGTYRWLQHSINPIGDPEMPIYTAMPGNFTIKPFIHTRYASMGVFGTSVLRCCVMSADDNGYSYYHVEDNPGIVDLSALPQHVQYCFTGKNMIPKTGDIWTLQNITLSRDASYNGSLVFIGSSVSSRQKEGPVVLAGGSFDISGHTVVLGPGTEIKEGTTVKITTNQNL